MSFWKSKDSNRDVGWKLDNAEYRRLCGGEGGGKWINFAKKALNWNNHHRERDQERQLRQFIDENPDLKKKRQELENPKSAGHHATDAATLIVGADTQGFPWWLPGIGGGVLRDYLPQHQPGQQTVYLVAGILEDYQRVQMELLDLAEEQHHRRLVELDSPPQPVPAATDAPLPLPPEVLKRLAAAQSLEDLRYCAELAKATKMKEMLEQGVTVEEATERLLPYYANLEKIVREQAARHNFI